MKIILLNYSEITSPGGVHKTIREIAKNMSIRGHDVIILQDNSENLVCEEYFENYHIIRVKSKISKYFYGLSPAMIFYLKKHLKKINPDIIHIHGYHTLFSVSIIFFLKTILKINAPIIFSPHFDISSHETVAGKIFWRPYNQLSKKIILMCNKIIVASKFEKNNVIKIFKILNSDCIIIPHGISNDPKMTLPPKKINDKIKLLNAGYLLELKGIQYIIESLHILKFNYNREVLLTIIGEGPYKKKLIDLSNRLNVSDSIFWRPFLNLDELNNEYRNADIFLLLSRSENYGIVIAEALSYGTPCIVTNNTALSEFTSEPGCYGVPFPPNPKNVAALILKIMNSPSVGPLSNRIKPWKEVANDYELLYKTICRQSS